MDIGDRPNVRDGLAVLRLRQLLAGSGADMVHAHGLRAGALAALALSLRPAGGPLPLVVTVHNAPPSAGVNGAIYQALELIVARSAAAVLCVSADLEERMRRAGARDVGRALVPSLGSAGPGSAELGRGSRGGDPAGTRLRAGTPGREPRRGEAIRRDLGAAAEPPLAAAAPEEAAARGAAALRGRPSSWRPGGSPRRRASPP